MMQSREDPQTMPHWERDTQVSSAMLAALADHPLTFDLTDQQRLDLVELAMQEKRFNDLPWLEATVLRIRAGETLLRKPAAEPSLTPVANPAVEIPVSRPILIESQEQLDLVLQDHANWIKQTLEPGKELAAGRANLRGNDLRAFQLEGRDLRAANLEGCDLRGVNLIGVNLAGANLHRAQLQGAKLDHAKLRRAKLSHANFQQASLRKADLRQALTQSTDWQGADLSETILEGQDGQTREIDTEQQPEITEIN